MKPFLIIILLFLITGCNGQNDYFIYPWSSIRGTIYNDANGGTIDGIATDAGGTLYVSLINSSSVCIGYKKVQSNGTFYFNRLRQGNYTAVLHTSNSCTNSPALPSGYSNTADGTSTSGDGVVNGIIPNIIIGTNVRSYKVYFGIQSTTYYSISGTLFDDVTDDGVINGTGTNISDQMYINLINSAGSVVSTQFIAGNGTFVFTGIVSGNYSLSIRNSSTPSTMPNLPSGYQYVGENLGTGAGNDGAIDGVLSNLVVSGSNLTNANFGIRSTPTYSVSGNVYIDNTSDGTVNGTGTNLSGQLYINIVNSGGTAIANVAVASNGTYTLTGLNPGNYVLKLAASSTLTNISSLPSGYSNNGENLGAGAGTDGNANGSLAVTITSTNITNANFGIQ